jgi:putative hydrolase of the HAD superfamily
VKNSDDRQIQYRYPTLLDISDSLPLLEVIYLDAVGTLFGVRDSVGQIYSEVASKYGVNCQPELLDRCFYSAFKNSSPCIFPSVTPADIPHHEYLWWREINRQTFTAAGVWDRFADFDAFFQDLYAYFTTPAAWVIYPDVIPALENWTRSHSQTASRANLKLGVLSNFDSRLYTVLEVLDLAKYFSTVTISTEVNAAKPQPEIFIAALEKYRCEPHLACHIGDSLKEDYQGAKSAGLNAIWLDRVTSPSLEQFNSSQRQ